MFFPIGFHDTVLIFFSFSASGKFKLNVFLDFFASHCSVLGIPRGFEVDALLCSLCTLVLGDSTTPETSVMICGDFQITVSIPDPSPELHDNTSNCLLGNLAWMFLRHLKFSMFKAENFISLPEQLQPAVLPVLPV